jgi:pimeloyl-ACP methyl ester carboxylesterase
VKTHTVSASRSLRSSTLVFTLALFLPVLSSAHAIAHRVRIEGSVGGRASPTVILENGLGDSLEVWDDVQPVIARNCARTFAYNRAGYEGSGLAAGMRDAHTIVAELRAELRQRGLKPPYVLVGHSLGGLYMQYFARTYADEVAGLVLVDSTHRNQRLWPSTGERRGGSVILFMSPIARRELAGSEAAGEQVQLSPSAPSIPTIVLSSTGVLRGETPASRVEAARFQEEIAAEFPNARHVRVEGSGHYIQNERPDTVIEAIREVVGCRR